MDSKQWTIHFPLIVNPFDIPSDRIHFLVFWIKEVVKQCFIAGLFFQKCTIDPKKTVVIAFDDLGRIGQCTQKAVTDFCRQSAEAMGLPKEKIWGLEYSDRMVYKQFLSSIKHMDYVYVKATNPNS